MKYLVIILLKSLILYSCISTRYIKNTSFKNTLLYQNKDSIALYQGYKVAIWKPTRKEIRLAESLIQQYINERNLIKNLNSYSRQYLGIIENERKIIQIEGFCVDPQEFLPGWKDGLIRVDDGGDCFFQIKVDLDLRECYGFGINSEG